MKEELMHLNTPWGLVVKAYARKGLCDANTLISCIAEDEYQIDKLPFDGVAIDLGGYIGGASLALAAKNWKVYCVEPIPENVAMISKNIELNGFEKRILVYPNAIAAKDDETIPVYYMDTYNELGRVHEFIGVSIPRKESDNSNALRNGKSTLVKTKTLESIFEENNIDRCNFLKVDIEGAEWDMFEKLPKKILSRVDRIAIEIDGQRDKPTSTSDFMKLLQGQFIDVSRSYFPKWCAPGEWVHGYYINKNL